MNKLYLSFLSSLLFFTLTFSTSFAQLSGTKTIDNTIPTGGNNYQSFTDAINALNGSGVGAGGVTFNVTTGQTFNENPPDLNATGTSTDPIVFQKFGGGANPKIMPSAVGTLTTTTLGNNADGIFIINGGDYITFDGIDLDANPTFATLIEKFEYGYYFKKASATDACKNVTIRNCTITMYHNTGTIVTIGNGFYVSNISGTATVTVTSTGGRTENVKIYNNTITGAYIPIQLRGFNHGSAPYDFYDQGIEVGADGANTLTNFGGGGSIVYGVYGIYQNNVKVNNNDFNNSNVTGAVLYGILFSTCNNSNIDIIGNTMSLTSNATTSQFTGIGIATGTVGTSNTINVNNNILTNFTRPTVTSGVTYLIYSTGSNPFIYNISGNTVSNFTTTSTGTTYGLNHASGSPGTLNITNNNFNNISRTSTTSTGALSAINLVGAVGAANTTISGNTIHSIAGSGSTGIVSGMQLSTTIETSVFNNNIYNISSESVSGIAYGIHQIGTTPACYIYNNYLSDIRTPSSTNAEGVRGINIASTSASSFTYVFYNTIYLNAVSSSVTTFGSSGISASVTPTVELRNNIITNNSTPGPTGGFTVAHRRSGTSLTTYSSLSNNNDFYAGTPSATNLIFYDGTNSDQTIGDYKTRVTPSDGASFTELPPFINTGATPYDLHLNTAIPTQCESGANVISTPIAITTDYDGHARYPNPGYPEKPGFPPTAPDVGADEFGGEPIDLTGPAIIYTELSNTSSLSNRNLTATVTDPSGVATGSNKPRLYYKKSTEGAYHFDNNPGQVGNDYTWSIDNANMGGVAPGDIIQYYVAAQDLLGNLSTNPNGGSGINPPGTTPPGSPNTYNIVTSFSGTYTIGLIGNYTTITAAVTAISAGDVTGPVIFNLLDATYPTETFPIVIPELLGTSSTNTVTFRPASGVNALVENAAGTGLFTLNGADYIRILGFNTSDGVQSLTLRNGGSTATEPGILLQNDAINNIIDGCIIETDNITTTEGAIQLGTSASGTTGNDNNTIQNCEIKHIAASLVAYAVGIYSSGTASISNSNNTITNNKIYNFTTSGVSVTATGNGDNWSITNNNFYNNYPTPPSTAQTTINFIPGTSSNLNVISGNNIGGSDVNCGGTAWINTGNITFTAISTNVGITGTSEIYNNTIKNIDMQGTGTAAFNGISCVTNGFLEVGVDGSNNIGGPTAGEQIKNAGNSTCIGISSTVGSTSDITIANNVIQNQYSSGTGTGIGNRGISHTGAGNLVISNNTIRNNRSDASTSADATSAVLGIYTSSANQNQLIDNNLIYGLEASHLTAAVTAQGIITTNASSLGIVTRNRIYGLKNATSSTAGDIFGIHFILGEWSAINNQVTIDQNTTGCRNVGIFDSSSATARNATFIYNSVFISGSNDVASTTNSYGFLRSNSGSTVYLRNNVLYNQRTGGSGFHYAIGNNAATPATGWGVQASEFNMFIPTDAFRVGEWGAGVNYTFAQWKVNTNCDFISMSFLNSDIPSTLFMDGSNGNLNINISDANSWYLKGNASQLTSPSVSNDYSNDSRSTSVIDGSTCIGSDEFTPSSVPPTLNFPVISGNNLLSIGGKPIGILNVVTTGTLTSVNVQYYSGTNPPNPPLSTLYGNGYISITPNGGASGYTYDILFYYISEVLGNIGNESDIRLAKSDNGGTNWTPYLTAGTGAGQYQLDMVNNTITVFGLNSFSIFALTDATAPLPVELASFTAISDRNNVKLNWTTSSEINNSGFDIERKLIDEQGLNTFVKIGNIQGHGNSNEPKNYSFNDNGLQTGKYTYRLKQSDYNGHFQYFNLGTEIEVGVPKEFALSQNYPNPFNPVTKIDYDIPFDSKVNLKIYDMLGREVASLVHNDLQKAGYYTVQLNGINMASGTYFFRIVAQGGGKDFVMTKKMVLIK